MHERWHKAENNDIKHLETLAKSSSKLQRVKEIVDRLRLAGQDKPEGLMITFFSPLVCYCVYKVCSVSINSVVLCSVF